MIAREKSEFLKSLTCDVLVAGGGPAGLFAALAAARTGVDVILCHDRPVLGGNASSEVRMHIVGADCSGKRCEELKVEARETGIIEEIRLEACVHNAQRSPSVFDLILYDKCRTQPGLRLMLNTRVSDVEVEDKRIKQVFARRDSTEDKFAIEAQVYIDCTWDSLLGARAGAAFYEGRESKIMFGEPLAQDKADLHRLGSSLMFQARKHSKPMPFTPPSWARKISEEDLRLRPHASASFELDLGLEYGYWWLEWGGTFDTVKDNELIRDELLAILLGVWDHVKNGGDHGADNWALEWCGFVPGKRESRRLVGQYTLTQQDIQEGRFFPDAIAYGGWHIDLHPPDGVDAPEEPPCVQHGVPTLYEIPLRSCISKTIDNLMFAGRNMSATHVAFASTRVMATCAIVGQGVGTAAALATKAGISPSAIVDNEALVAEIQQRLLRDGVFLLGMTNEDPLDLAQRAQVSASSQTEDGPAVNIISGQTRSVHGKGGAPPDRANPGTHRWMSDPAHGLPAWLMLEWTKPEEITEVHLTFDTGLHRVLTFSLANEYTSKMIWGTPQPETVRDYCIEVMQDDKWLQVLRIEGNYQRHRVHKISKQSVKAIRVTVRATNGLNHARICEVRVYP